MIRLPLFRQLSTQHLLDHPVRSLLTITGIALGAAMVFAALIANFSLTRSLLRQNEAVHGGANLQVRTPATAGLDASAVRKIERTPGVEAAAPIAQGRVLVAVGGQRTDAIIVGYDKRALELQPAVIRELEDGSDGRGELFTTTRLLADVGWQPGKRIALSAGGRRLAFSRAVVTRAAAVERVFDGRLIVLPLSTAQTLLGSPGRFNRILVRSRDRGEGDGVLKARLARRMGPGAEVVPADQDAAELEQSTQQLRATTLLLSLLALALGGFVVFNTIAVGVAERRRELATLLAVGDTRRGLVLRLFGEAVVLGLLGIAIGLPLGYAIGTQVIASTPSYISETYGFGLETIVPAWTVVAAGLAAVAVSVAGAVLPAIRLSRLPPAAALRDESTAVAEEPAGVGAMGVTGAVFVVIGALVVAFAPKLSLLAVLVLLAGFALLAPSLLRAAVAFVASRLERKANFAPVLAGGSLRGNADRSLATISAATFALAIVIGLGSITANLSNAVRDFTDRFQSLDLIVSVTPGAFPLVPFGNPEAQELSDLPGVAEAAKGQYAFASWKGRRILIVGLGPAFFENVHFEFEAPAERAIRRGLAPDEAIVSTQIKEMDGIDAGDRISFPLPGHPRAFRVSGVFENLAWLEGAVFVSSRAFASALRESEPEEVYLRLRDPAAATGVERAAKRLLPGAVVETGREYGGEGESNLKGLLAAFFAISNFCVLIASLAVLNTMLTAVLRRRRQLAILLATGIRPRQLQASLMVEAAAAVGIGLVGAVVIGLVLQIAGLRYLVASTGFPLSWEPVPAALAIGLAAGLVITVLGSFFPARSAVRVSLRESIAYE